MNRIYRLKKSRPIPTKNNIEDITDAKCKR